MSATLPASIARSLVAAYAAGAGCSARALPATPSTIPVGCTCQRTPVRQSRSRDGAGSERGHRTSKLLWIYGRYALSNDARKASQTNGLNVLQSLLAPVATEDGCVAVVCNTVADAQATFKTLREWIGRLDGDVPALDLLHSRFTARERTRRTAHIVGRYGKDGKRPPGGGIVVATQVIEQSLDLDFDLIVSDLAPFAQLLQRAGRGHRHERTGRPGWVKDHRLVVLVPVDSEGSLRVRGIGARFIRSSCWQPHYQTLNERENQDHHSRRRQ